MSAHSPVQYLGCLLSPGGKRRQGHLAIGRHLNNLIDDRVHGILASRQVFDGDAQQVFRPVTANGRQNYQSRVYVPRVDERTEVAGVLGHENEVLVDTPTQDFVVRCPEPAEVTRMDGDMRALCIEGCCDTRRQAFVEK